GRDDRTAPVPAFRSEVDDMIRHFDDIQVVLYDNDRIPVIHKTLDDIDKFPYVFRMEAGRRFIQYIEGFAVGPPVQLGSEFDTLCFTACKCRCRLSEFDVAQTHIKQCLYPAFDLGQVFEEVIGFLDSHRQNIRDAFVLVFHFHRLSIITLSVTYFTWYEYIRQKMHFNLYD